MGWGRTVAQSRIRRAGPGSGLRALAGAVGEKTAARPLLIARRNNVKSPLPLPSVYLVDDHALLRDSLHTALVAHGLTVVGTASDCERAVADIQRDAPDVALVDLRLGRCSGFELLSELGRVNASTQCIVLTMSKEPEDVKKALRLGARGYVLKHSPLPVLLAAIDAVICGNPYLDEEVAQLALGAVAGESCGGNFSSLSSRERQITAFVARGCSSAAIGRSLGLSPKTVDTYRSRLMKKLGVADVPALVRWAVRSGVVSLDE